MRICNVLLYISVLWDKLLYMKIWYPLQPIFSIIQPLKRNFNFHIHSTVSVADCLLRNVSPDVVISTFTDTALSSTLSVVQRSLWIFFCFFKLQNKFFEENLLNVKNNVFHQKRVNNTLSISPRWLSDDHLLPRYGQKRVVYEKCPNILITAPTPPNYEKKKNKLFRRHCLTNRKLLPPYHISHENFSPRYGPKRVFLWNDQISYLRNHPPKMKSNKKNLFSSTAPYQCASNKPSNTLTWSFFAEIWPITSFHQIADSQSLFQMFKNEKI